MDDELPLTEWSGELRDELARHDNEFLRTIHLEPKRISFRGAIGPDGNVNEGTHLAYAATSRWLDGILPEIGRAAAHTIPTHEFEKYLRRLTSALSKKSIRLYEEACRAYSNADPGWLHEKQRVFEQQIHHVCSAAYRSELGNAQLARAYRERFLIRGVDGSSVQNVRSTPGVGEDPVAEAPEEITPRPLVGCSRLDSDRRVDQSGANRTQPTAASHAPTSSPAKTRPAFPKRALWLKERLRERSWNKHDLSRHGGPDHKTVQKMLDSRCVREDVLGKVAAGLSKTFDKVNLLQIPQD